MKLSLRNYTTRFLVAIFAFCALFVTMPIAVNAQVPTVPLYTVEDFFVFPEVLSYSISPDGEYLIFTAPVNGVINVFTRNIETDEVTQLTFEEEQHVMGAFFKGYTLLIMQDGFGDENFHIFRINDDGSKTNLTPFEGAMAMPVDLLEDTYLDDEILIASNRENPTAFNIYRLNINTAEMTLVFPAVDGLMFDNDGVARIIVQVVDANMHILHRYSDDDEFEPVKIVDFRDTLMYVLFDSNNEYVYAISNIGRDTMALVKVNPATGEELEVLFEHPDYDVNNIMRGLEPGVVVGVSYIGDFFNAVFFDDVEDEALDIRAEALEHFPEGTELNFMVARYNRNIAIVSTASDVDRGRQYIFDREEDTMTLLVDFNFTDTENMAPMTPVRYTARDGLEIQGYLTIPVGVEAYDLPVVVIVHGGPWARDTWCFRDEVQFLANRGYAVFQPNFRGSTGFGREFLDAGDGEWGLSMQDDITDGVLWLIEKGLADPDRVAIYGGSYGGYAALAAVTFTPDLFAASIAYVPVSNLFTLLESIPPIWESERRLFDERVGHLVYDYERLVATSPVFHVDRVVTPLFIAHGANDVRTTLQESVQFVYALNNLDIDTEFMVRWDEGHGFINEQNRLQFYATMEAFLAEHIGGRTGNTLAELTYSQTLEEVLEIMEYLGMPTGIPVANVASVTIEDSVDVKLIPVNVDGRQGVIVLEGHLGEGETTFTLVDFSDGMDSVNIRITDAEGNVLAFAMEMPEGETLVFEHIGGDIVVVMSTNSRSGNAVIEVDVTE